MRVIANTKNAGVFAQWRRAAETAVGEYIWLCEADDAAEPGLLAKLVEACTGALLAFADSRAVDEHGQQVMADYKSYYFDAGAKTLMASGVWPARAFAEAHLPVRNLIPNVSAVLWRRAALLQALDAVPDLASWQLAGDWRLYLALAEQEGDIAYVAAPLNIHRRHGGGVTQKLSAAAHLAEIARMQSLAAMTLKLGKGAKAAQTADLARVEAQLRHVIQKPQAALRGGTQKPAKPVARSKKV